jgi:predicted unusual protein kinase regulating ubiquinone biosynthesis (AarF/ABC1/UbiB family)
MSLHFVGLVTKLTDDQKYGMIEAIAHLIHRDYDAIVKDFVKLGFIPEGVNLDPILPVLAKVFDQALEGGGAKNINFQELAADLAQITFDYPFKIPPYFALIIRAIGVLEGIALVGDPEFAIVDEAYPYIAQVSIQPLIQFPYPADKFLSCAWILLQLFFIFYQINLQRKHIIFQMSFVHCICPIGS